MSVLITLHSLCPQALVMIVCVSAVLTKGRRTLPREYVHQFCDSSFQEFPKQLLAPSVNLGQDSH